jgi:hypothetical protein
MVATNKHQQLILLEPERAEMLQELAKMNGTTKQELLREAVDLLLAKSGVPGVSHEVDTWRQSLLMCFSRLANARQIELPDAADSACADVMVRVGAILENWKVSKRTLRSYDPNPPIGANSHRAKLARKAKEQ